MLGIECNNLKEVEIILNHFNEAKCLNIITTFANPKIHFR